MGQSRAPDGYITSASSGRSSREPLGWRKASVASSTTAAGVRRHDPHRLKHMRTLVSSGSPLEPKIGFSRAVRVGDFVAVAGTAPIAAGGGVASPGDVYGQTMRCLEIIAQSLEDSGLSLSSVVRTRVMLTDISRWEEAARAHGELFSQIRPACTFVEVKAFINPEWLVELEADAIAV